VLLAKNQSTIAAGAREGPPTRKNPSLAHKTALKLVTIRRFYFCFTTSSIFNQKAGAQCYAYYVYSAFTSDKKIGILPTWFARPAARKSRFGSRRANMVGPFGKI
jgi:hypothetical protein